MAAAMSAGFFDRRILFSDRGVWIYFSLYLLMPIGPLLMVERRQIVRYALGIMLISTLADLIFIFWPTWCPRPTGISGTTAAYRMLIAIDSPFDAFPSLHAAFAVFSALYTGRVLREMHSPGLWTIGIWLWTFLILLATLTTKQHMLADIAGGSVLGFGVYGASYVSALAARRSGL
jgi:membrane-associated phospholipid phosphatase